MSEAQRKAIYAAAVALLGVLGAYGVVDSAMQDQILGIVSGALTLVMAVVPLLAHRKVGVKGVDSLGALTADDIPAAAEEEPAGLTAADIPPADDDSDDAAYVPEHAETAEVTPTADGGPDPAPAVQADATDPQGHTA